MTAETRQALKLAVDATVRAGLPVCAYCDEAIVRENDDRPLRHDSRYCDRRCQILARKAAQLALTIAA